LGTTVSHLQERLETPNDQKQPRLFARDISDTEVLLTACDLKKQEKVACDGI